MAKNGGYGFAAYLAVTLALAAYFAFAAVQGDLGVIKRLQVTAGIERLEAERDALSAEVTALENRTQRLSDDFLDLDLLDERARAVLGYMRADELVVR